MSLKNFRFLFLSLLGTKQRDKETRIIKRFMILLFTCVSFPAVNLLRATTIKANYSWSTTFYPRNNQQGASCPSHFTFEDTKLSSNNHPPLPLSQVPHSQETVRTSFKVPIIFHLQLTLPIPPTFPLPFQTLLLIRTRPSTIILGPILGTSLRTRL